MLGNPLVWGQKITVEVAFQYLRIMGRANVKILDMHIEAKEGRLEEKTLLEWRDLILVMQASYDKKDQLNSVRDTLPKDKKWEMEKWEDMDFSFVGMRDQAKKAREHKESPLTEYEMILAHSQGGEGEGYLVFKGSSTKGNYVTDAKILAAHLFKSTSIFRPLGRFLRASSFAAEKHTELTMEKYVESAADKLREVKTKRLVVVGHSLGGFRAGYVGSHKEVIKAIWENNGGAEGGAEFTDEQQARTLEQYVKIVSFDPVGWASYFKYPAEVQEALNKSLRIVSFCLTAVSGTAGGKQAGPVYCSQPRYPAWFFGWKKGGCWTSALQKRFQDHLAPASQPPKEFTLEEYPYLPLVLGVDKKTPVEVRSIEPKNFSHQHETIRCGIEDVLKAQYKWKGVKVE